MKKRILSFGLAVFVLLSAVTLFSCEEKLEKYSEYSFEYFDTVTSITGYEKSQEDFDAVSDQILQELGEYHRLFTIYKRYEGLNNLCVINQLDDGVHSTVKVDGRIIDMLLYAKDIYYKTGGKVNIAMGSVLSIWHEYREEGSNDPASAKLPPVEKLEEAAKHTDIENMVIDKEAGTVFLSDPQMKLDVGAIAKGYAVEMVAKSLEEQGITGYVLNVGGNVRTIGRKGDGEKWLAGIENPSDDGDAYLQYLELEGESLVTSGSYQRFYVVDGKSYHHIIDSETLMPSELYTSVSVVCKSSADGDALSTALFCMSIEEGKALLETIDGAEAMWLLPDGTMVFSDGFEAFVVNNG